MLRLRAKLVQDRLRDVVNRLAGFRRCARDGPVCSVRAWRSGNRRKAARRRGARALKHAPDPIPYCAGNGRQHSPSGAANGSFPGRLAPIVFRVGFGCHCRADCADRCACSGPTKESRSGRDARSERNITRRCEVSGEARSVEPVAASAGPSSFVLCIFGFDAVVYPAFDHSVFARSPIKRVVGR